jgi:hypothetical protein
MFNTPFGKRYLVEHWKDNNILFRSSKDHSKLVLKECFVKQNVLMAFYCIKSNDTNSLKLEQEMLKHEYRSLSANFGDYEELVTPEVDINAKGRK